VAADHSQVCLFATSPMHLIVDVEGSMQNEAFQGSMGSEAFVSMNSRLLDSRGGVAAKRLPSDTTTRVAVKNSDGSPMAADASAVLNVTVTNPIDSGYLVVYPCDMPPPPSSNVNFAPGQTIANAVITTGNADGEVCLFNQSSTDVIVDLGGIFQERQIYRFRSPYVGVTPTRIVDTRQ
jgi:predicted regulator of Ras-like GTPase activity (Roadblock/LC7/MglB family)